VSIRDEIVDTFGEDAEGIMFADGFDRAIVGVGRTFDGLLCAVYDIDKIIQILMKDGMNYDEAHEFFDYNIAGSYVGEQTPIFMHAMSVNHKQKGN
jgi:hypothetical protein